MRPLTAFAAALLLLLRAPCAWAAAGFPAGLDAVAAESLSKEEACRQSQEALDADVQWPDPGSGREGEASCLIRTSKGEALLTRGQHAWALRRAWRSACKGKHEALLPLLRVGAGSCLGGIRVLSAVPEADGCRLRGGDGSSAFVPAAETAELAKLRSSPLPISLLPPGAGVLLREAFSCLRTEGPDER